MAAQELELKVESSKYAQRIAMLGGYIDTMNNLVLDYQTMKDRVADFLGDNDDQLDAMRENVQKRIERVQKAIEATQANIDTLQETVRNMENLGQNVSTIIQEGLTQATLGLFD